MGPFDCDTLVVGSGFGGGVAALRLAESGRRVLVVEMGRRVSADDMRRGGRSPRHLLWAPRVGLHGYYRQTLLPDVLALSGVGVGGGSLVYAAVLLEANAAVFADPAWEGADWQVELAPHYATAARMLGRTVNPTFGAQDAWLREAARSLGVADSYGPTPQGIDFDTCISCGACMTGCPEGAKNTVDRTYLAQAEALGVRVVPELQVTCLTPLAGGGYRVNAVGSLQPTRRQSWRAREVVLAAGVLGTNALLLACRDRYRTLPGLSAALGYRVRTNSETFVGVQQPDAEADVTVGTGISSDFWPDETTHVTNNRMPPSWGYMRALMSPLVDDVDTDSRAAAALRQVAADPGRLARAVTARNWTRRMTLLTVMQAEDTALILRYRRRLGRWRLTSSVPQGVTSAPMPALQAAAAVRAVAEASGGEAFGTWTDTLLRRSFTAHLLGGAVVGVHPSTSVVDPDHEVHGYRGLFVADGSAVPANVGVNPSLTITAMAERAMTRLAQRSPG